MGDDSRNEYIYKFVSEGQVGCRRRQRRHRRRQVPDEGTLYVAKFNNRRQRQWLELTYGKNGIDASNTPTPLPTRPTW
jgi:secreted PhoX family phosphatase